MRDAMTTSNRNVPDNGCATASNGTALLQRHENPSTPAGKATVKGHADRSIPLHGSATTPQSKIPTVRLQQSYAATTMAAFKSP
jgi:hypothetical protein